MIFFPEGYEPTNKDILCGRGKGNLRHEGNQHFMEIIRANLERYNNAPKRIDKSLVVSLIVSSLKDDGYKFVRQDTKSRMWFQLSEPQVHEKAGHAIRDILKKGGNAVQQQSQSKQAINTSNNFDSAQTNEPDIVASQILSTALKVSKLVEKSKLDFTALSCSQTMAPDYVASSDPQRRNSREYRRSSIVRLFDELSPEEPADALSSGGFMNDQPLPIDARNSGALRTSDMMQVFESLANSTSDAPHHQRQQQGEEEEESIITPRSKRMGSSSREFRRSELLQFLDFNEDELMEPEEQAKGTPSTDQPLSMDSRTSDTLNSLFKDQEDIFSNLQNVFGSLPDAANADQSPQEMEERNSRASQVLSELLKRQEGIFEELQNFEAEFDVQ
ncbi:unnamed protein product [Cylindrotheca closterium]|uniref:DUF6824 domain-containing protein n=1 Tax=Cylindrotheca closterium TaxID=2856 RepID=A0AAD2G0Y1_9STRA|nr:unnamed protein product [Cylindrotheca closterium]